MTVSAATELWLIRHAPVIGSGVTGRRDLPADCTETPALGGLRAALADVPGGFDVTLTSPALRCRQTAAALGLDGPADPRLWEQDFGAWEGLDAAPDLGPLDPVDLARHRPPGGESFADLCDRAQPALVGLGGRGRAIVVAHAGIVRAGLALALGSAAPALAFEVAPLSATILRLYPEGVVSVAAVNRRWP